MRWGFLKFFFFFEINDAACKKELVDYSLCCFVHLFLWITDTEPDSFALWRLFWRDQNRGFPPYVGSIASATISLFYAHRSGIYI